MTSRLQSCGSGYTTQRLSISVLLSTSCRIGGQLSARNFIMAGKKRKLPKDLHEATAMATACLNTPKKIADACQVLKNTCLEEMAKGRSTDLSTEDAAIYLIARYGLKDISKICSVMSRLPDTLPAVYKAWYTNECTNRRDADVIATQGG